LELKRLEKLKQVSEALFNLIPLLQSRFHKSFQENYICGLPKSHFKVLLVLKRSGQQNLKTIAEKLEMAVPNASKVLRDLEEKSYINRCIPENNRRVTLFTLSDAGAKLLAEVKETIKTNIENVIVKLDNDDLSRFNDALNTVHELFNKALTNKGEK
jgi:DNA-binding MarR family transcriptional regulator